MKWWRCFRSLGFPILAGGLTVLSVIELQANASDFDSYQWSLVNPSSNWAPRAGLEVVYLNDSLFLMGGRTPSDPVADPVFGASTIWGDVWRSDDFGQSWVLDLDTVTPGHWAARAYFEAVTKNGRMFVLGGQDFDVQPNPDPNGPPLIPVSNIFNDVWSSSDGINWEPMTTNAGWEGRAGLSSVVYQDDIYMLGGEDGFTCESGGPRCPPYFNDVWRTQDGGNWELVTSSADWAARPGHVAVVVENDIVIFGGFGLSTDPSDPFKPANPIDMWVSEDGADWELLNCTPARQSVGGSMKRFHDELARPLEFAWAVVFR